MGGSQAASFVLEIPRFVVINDKRKLACHKSSHVVRVLSVTRVRFVVMSTSYSVMLSAVCYAESSTCDILCQPPISSTTPA